MFTFLAFVPPIRVVRGILRDTSGKNVPTVGCGAVPGAMWVEWVLVIFSDITFMLNFVHSSHTSRLCGLTITIPNFSGALAAEVAAPGPPVRYSGTLGGDVLYNDVSASLGVITPMPIGTSALSGVTSAKIV